MDSRRVCDLSAAELAEIFASRIEAGEGSWTVALHLEDGRVRSVKATEVHGVPASVSFGRRQLARVESNAAAPEPDLTKPA